MQSLTWYIVILAPGEAQQFAKQSVVLREPGTAACFTERRSWSASGSVPCQCHLPSGHSRKENLPQGHVCVCGDVWRAIEIAQVLFCIPPEHPENAGHFFSILPPVVSRQFKVSAPLVRTSSVHLMLDKNNLFPLLKIRGMQISLTQLGQ